MTNVEYINTIIHGGELKEHIGYVEGCDYIGQYQLIIADLSIIEILRYDHINNALVLEVYNKKSDEIEQFERVSDCIDYIQRSIKQKTIDHEKDRIKAESTEQTIKVTAKWPNGSEKVAPVIGTAYWFIDNERGAVEDTYEGHNFDNLKLGNKELFLTYKSASKADTMKDRKSEMMVEIGKIDKEWTADWEDSEQEKCSIYLDYNRTKFSLMCADSRTYSQGITYMSEEAAQHILSEAYTNEDRMAFMGIVADKKQI